MFIILVYLILKLKFTLVPKQKNIVEKSFVTKVFEEKWLTCIVLNIKVRSRIKLLDLM